MTAPAPTPRTSASGLAANAAAAFGFSWGFILVKLVGMPSPVLGFWRLCIGAAGLTATALLLRANWPARRLPVLIAGVFFGAHQLLFITATQLTSVAIVTLVGAAAPLLVALASQRLVGEAVPRALFAYAALALVGVGIVVHANAGDASRSVLGDALAVLNLFVFVGYFLTAKKARQGGVPTLTFTAGMLWVALAVVSPVLALVDFATPDGRQFGLLAVLALGSGNGHLLINWAHNRISAALSSLLLAAVPLLSSVWAHLVLDEPYTWQHVAGMLVFVVALEGGRRAQLRHH